MMMMTMILIVPREEVPYLPINLDKAGVLSVLRFLCQQIWDDWHKVSSSVGPWGDDWRREGIVFLLWTFPCPGCLGKERLWQGGSGYWDTQVIVKPGEGKQRTAVSLIFFDRGVI